MGYIVVYNHLVFTELAKGLYQCLLRANLPAHLTTSLHPRCGEDRGNLYLLYGLGNWDRYQILPPYYVALQLEQVPPDQFSEEAGASQTTTDDVRWFTPLYLQRLQGALSIWDYSLVNIQRLKGLLPPETLSRVAYVPLGYVSGLWPEREVGKEGQGIVEEAQALAKELSSEQEEATMLGRPVRDIDLLFFGVINERRQLLLDVLCTAHPEWRVRIANYGLWGQERDRIIRRSRIVLNLHYYLHPILETARLTWCLSLGALVVSEKSTDPLLDRAYSPLVHFVPEGDSSALLQRCESLLALSSTELEAERQRRTRAFWESESWRYQDGIPWGALRAAATLCRGQALDYSDYHQAEYEITEGAYRLLLPELPSWGYCRVSIVTPTYRRGHLFPLAIRNWYRIDYPRDLLEWLILDDTEEDRRHSEGALGCLEQEGLLSDPRVKYLPLDERMNLGDKRNRLAELASGDIIVHMDDDDYYFPSSVMTKVRLLMHATESGSFWKCVGSRELGVYNLLTGQSHLHSTQSFPEAGMAYYRSFWEKRPFESTCGRWGEGAAFLAGREKQCCDFPYIFNFLALSHGSNITGRLREGPSAESQKLVGGTAGVNTLSRAVDFDTELFFLRLNKACRKRIIAKNREDQKMISGQSSGSKEDKVDGRQKHKEVKNALLAN